VKLGECLCATERAHAGGPQAEITQATTGSPAQARPTAAKPPAKKIEPIDPEHLARTISLVQYLADKRRPEHVTWATLREDLGFTRQEVEADLSLINLVNFGGGTYAIDAATDNSGVNVTRDVMADVFARPARLSPLMTRALLLALDLLGEAIKMDSTESLASVREKVRLLAGSIPDETGVMIDDVVHPSPDLVDVLNQAIRDRRIAEIEYFTPTRGRLATRKVEPYLLFRSREGWYLEAFCLEASAQRTFRVEFIRSALLTPDLFSPRPEVDLSSRLMSGMFPESQTVCWASVRFSPRWRSYLEDRGIAHEPLSHGEMRAHMPYLDERWMIREVVRFLGDAVLESPATAREGVRMLSASLSRAYTQPGPSVPKGCL
jgi:proteasome accessory factor C